MKFYEIVLIGIGLGMDAFSVSISKGLDMKSMNWNKAIIVGTYFGLFQAVMPIIGFYLGMNFQFIIRKYSSIIAFVILSLIGINMIIETIKNKHEKIDASIDFKSMFVLSLATSIDALAVGITLAILNMRIFEISVIIGIITFGMSVLGVKIGFILGEKLKNSAGLMGGSILIMIGIKMLVV